MPTPFVDIHCHPSIKPYGQSFSGTPGENSANRRRKNSLWHYDSPNLFERAIQLLTGVTKFTQSDCTSMVYGNARIICVSLYPIERGFFNNELGTSGLSDLASDFVTSVGRDRVNYVQSVRNYHEDVMREYDFYRQLDGTVVRTESGPCRYRLVTSYQQIDDHLNAEPDDVSTVFLIITIEGLHVLQADYNERAEADAETVMANVVDLKSWKHPPFFVTLAHHFYNHLSGHARSLTGLVGNTTDQSYGLNQPLTDLGKRVITSLLDKTNGRRILVDIKHMSATARRQYLAILATDYAGEEIPVIMSHGAANGLRSLAEPVADSPETSPKLLAEDINFYDDELLAVARSKGLIGLQLDERRIASKATLQNIKHAIPLNKIRHYRSELLWNQVLHIAELLDRNGLFAWDLMSIGSDFDGVINPLNGFLTAETFPHLLEYLERYVFNYMEGAGKARLKDFNQIPPSEIVNRIFSTNAMDFLRRNFL